MEVIKVSEKSLKKARSQRSFEASFKSNITHWVDRAKRPPRDHDTTRPVASWTEQEILEGERVEAFVAILRTRGCYWSIRSGCSMCGYFNDTVPGGVNQEDLSIQWQSLMGSYQGQPLVKLYTSGSFIDAGELDPKLQLRFVQEVAKGGARKVMVESLPEFVHERTLTPLVEAMGEGTFEVALGLESANEEVLAKCVNKKLTRQGFRRACEAALKAGISLKAYVLLKPPFLTEAAAISDAVEAARFAAECGCKTVSLNPVNIQKFTLVERLWKRNEFQPPWLWSVVEAIQRFEKENVEVPQAGKAPENDKEGSAKVRFYSDPTGGGSRRGAHNCGKCNDRVLKALTTHRLGDEKALQYVLAEGCVCRSSWQAELEMGELFRGGWGLALRLK